MCFSYRKTPCFLDFLEFCLGLRPSYALDLPAFLDFITIWSFGLSLDYVWITMATDTTAMDLDSRRNCSTCKTRKSSLMHDSHLMCTNCHGCDCNMDIRCAFHEVNFAERVREFAEEVAASEGHINVLRLLYQFCPGAAPKSQPAPRKACDFEGLYAPSDTAPVAEGSPTLFHRVAELREEHQARLRVAAEAGKAVASALPSRRRDRGCCSDPAIESSTPMNPSIPRLVGALSSRHSLNFNFEEAATVEFLCKCMLAAQSSGFSFFSALLHWLKELGFEAPDPSLFGQLVQEVSGSLVTAANSASGLAAFMLAKRREGVPSHFPSHVGPPFQEGSCCCCF